LIFEIIVIVLLGLILLCSGYPNHKPKLDRMESKIDAILKEIGYQGDLKKWSDVYGKLRLKEYDEDGNKFGDEYK
jgi:hypothetical protein